VILRGNDNAATRSCHCRTQGALVLYWMQVGSGCLLRAVGQDMRVTGLSHLPRDL